MKRGPKPKYTQKRIEHFIHEYNKRIELGENLSFIEFCKRKDIPVSTINAGIRKFQTSSHAKKLSRRVHLAEIYPKLKKGIIQYFKDNPRGTVSQYQAKQKLTQLQLSLVFSKFGDSPKNYKPMGNRSWIPHDYDKENLTIVVDRETAIRVREKAKRMKVPVSQFLRERINFKEIING